MRLKVFQWWMKRSFVNSLSALLEIHEQNSYLQSDCDVTKFEAESTMHFNLVILF